MKNQKAVLFDFDGVIVDSLQNHYISWKYILSKYDIQITLEEIAINEGEKAEESMRRFLQEKKSLIVEDSKIKQLVQEKRRIYKTLPPPKVRNDAIALLRNLSMLPFQLGLVSGSVLQNIKLSLSNDLLSLFQVLVTGEDTERGKPYPDPFLYAAKKLSVSPPMCYVVENAPLGIKAAKMANMKVIGITTTLSEEYLKGADFIVNTYPEILEIVTAEEKNSYAY